MSVNLFLKPTIRAAQSAGLGSFLNPDEMSAMLDGTVSNKNIKDVRYARLGAAAFDNIRLFHLCDDLLGHLKQQKAAQSSLQTMMEGIKDAFNGR